MMNKNQARIEFTAPEGFVAPEGAEGGEPFDMVCTLKVKPDGKTICITKLGDMDLPYDDEKSGGYEEERPDYRSMAQNVVGDLQS